MKFINQLKSDIDHYQGNHEVVCYLFSKFDINTVEKVFTHTGSLCRFFVLCQSPTTYSHPFTYNKALNQAFRSSGYVNNFIKNYYIDEIADVQKLEGAVKIKFGGKNYRPIRTSLYNFRPYLKRYLIQKPFHWDPGPEIVLYHVIYDPIVFLELIRVLEEKIEKQIRIGLLLNELDRRYVNLDLFQPQKKLFNLIQPRFIVSPQIYWKKNNRNNGYFNNWTDVFADPVEIDDKLVIVHRSELRDDKENNYYDFRTLREVAVLP